VHIYAQMPDAMALATLRRPRGVLRAVHRALRRRPADGQLFQPDRCEQLAADLRAGGSRVDIIPNRAAHQRDGVMERRLIGRKSASRVIASAAKRSRAWPEIASLLLAMTA
jgi:hypothetical protein